MKIDSFYQMNPRRLKLFQPPSLHQLVKRDLPKFVRIENPLTVYHEIKQINRGAFGSVFQISLRSTGEQFAMKVLDVQSEICMKSALMESQIALSMDHPRVCKTYEVYYHNDQIFLIMELMSVGTLNQSTRALIMRELIDAIMYIHSRGVLHRDIKSSNVGIVLDADGVSHFKIFDFGASCYKDDVPKDQSPVGTIYYMSPEVLINTEYSIASEMWAFMCMIVEIHTGNPPNYEKDPENVTWFISQMKEPPIPDVLKTDYSKYGQHIFRILKRGFEIDPALRMTFQELLDILP